MSCLPQAHEGSLDASVESVFRCKWTMWTTPFGVTEIDRNMNQKWIIYKAYHWMNEYFSEHTANTYINVTNTY